MATAMRPCQLVVSVVAVTLLSACANRCVQMEPQRGAVSGMLAADADMRAELVGRDPVAYLHHVADKCSTLSQYTLHFTRQERRGLFQQLGAPEHISCHFRRRPFSVRMKWLDDDSKFKESAYVEGQADNKVRFVTRWWIPPLLPPPAVNRVDLPTPVLLGESKRPMTDFGLERLMQRTLDTLHAAGDEMTVTYRGLLRLDGDGRSVHHIRLEYSAGRHRVPIQDLYVDISSDLPAGTILRLASGEIDASYFYSDLNTAVDLADADFLLGAERTAGPAGN